MYQSNQAKAIISVGFPQGAGRPPNPSRHLVNSTRGYCSAAAAVTSSSTILSIPPRS